MRRYIFPLVFFILLLIFLALGLRLNPREVPSPLIGKPAPDFLLSQVSAPDKLIAASNLRGQVWLLNVWASWCEACREEHSLLMDFSNQHQVAIVGLNYKDGREPAQALLQREGNPYVVSGFDADGRVGIDYGVYGVPETFVIDKAGVIRYKHIGALTSEVIANQLLPLIKELNGA